MPAHSSRTIIFLAATCLWGGLLGHSARAADAHAPSEPAAAEDKASEDAAAPLIAIEGDAELQMDAGFGKHRTTAIFATIEPEITVNLSDTFRLFGHFILEPVEDPFAGKTNAFHGEGLYAEELYAALTLDNIDVELGKIDPMFGVATDEAPGIYGSYFAGEYDFKGALGLSAKITMSETAMGEGDDAITVTQAAHLSMFTADPSVVSRSLFTDRGQFSWHDARVGNTDLPESFDLAYMYSTLNADDEVAGPTGRIALRRLAARQGNAPDEWGIVAAGQTAFDLGDERVLRPIAEIAYFIHEGGSQKNAAAATLGLEFQQGDWIASLVAAGHERFNTSGPADYMLTASFGRIFKTGMTGEFRVDIAYSNARMDGAATNIIGLLLHKDFGWNSASGGL